MPPPALLVVVIAATRRAPDAQCFDTNTARAECVGYPITTTPGGQRCNEQIAPFVVPIRVLIYTMY